MHKLTKDKNIFDLYSKLKNNGSKGKAVEFIANLCGVKKVTVRTQWLAHKELPDYLKEDKKDKIISYLQKAVNINNGI